MRVEAKWEVEDGYCGGSRPQYTTIDVDKDVWDNMSESQQEDYVLDKCHEDFKDNYEISVDGWEVE